MKTWSKCVSLIVILFLVSIAQLFWMDLDDSADDSQAPNRGRGLLRYPKAEFLSNEERRAGTRNLSRSREEGDRWGLAHMDKTLEPRANLEDRPHAHLEDVTFPPIRVPHSYLKRYKNPCWYANPQNEPGLKKSETLNGNLLVRRMISPKRQDRRDTFLGLWTNRTYPALKCVPYLFIVGMEKCGTTDMYIRLTAHPKVLRPPLKEIQWWTRRRLIPMRNDRIYVNYMADEMKLKHKEDLVQVPFIDYASFYDDQARKISRHPDSVLVDASANSFYWNDFAEMYTTIDENGPRDVVADDLRRAIPQARIIISLRDPVTRLYSNYVFFNKPSYLSSAIFHRKAERAIVAAKRCFAQYGPRRCAYDVKLKAQMDPTVNVLSGMYIVFLRDWVEAFGRDQVHVVHFETYRNDTRAELQTILESVLDIRGTKELDWTNMLRTQPALQSQSRYQAAGKMLKRTVAMLEQFYRPFNEQLARFLNDQRFAWAKHAKT